MNPCPECGHPIEGKACMNCGYALANGQVKSPVRKPPEVSSWVIQKTPPEMIEEMRRTFHEEEFLVEAREAERSGGVPFEDIIGDIEEMVKRRDGFR